MVNVNFIDELEENTKCSSCNCDMLQGEECFDIALGTCEAKLCVDCGNDLINKMLYEFTTVKK